jgi:hypothetical protein
VAGSMSGWLVPASSPSIPQAGTSAIAPSATATIVIPPDDFFMLDLLFR